MKLVIAVTLALSFIATPTANAQQRVEASYTLCMKKTKLSSVTTSKGSKDVRKELNRLALDVVCRVEDLRRVRAAESARRNNERERVDAAFAACLAKNGFTETSWYKRYSPFLGTKGPCMKEAKDRSSATLGSPSTGFKEWDAHVAWLDATVMLGNLAKIYPNSVKPTLVARYINNGRLATQCVSSKRWCFQG